MNATSFVSFGVAAVAWGVAAALAVISTMTKEAGHMMPWLVFMVTVAATASICMAIERAKATLLQEVRDEFNCVGTAASDPRRLSSI